MLVENCVSVWVAHNIAFLQMPTLPKQAFLFLCGKEGALAVGSGSSSVFYHFFVFVPWLLSWASSSSVLPHSEVGPHSAGTALGRNAGKWGHIVSLGTSVLSQTHMWPSTCLCYGKIKFVLAFSVTKAWNGK